MNESKWNNKRNILLASLLFSLFLIFLISFGEPYFTSWREKQDVAHWEHWARLLLRIPDMLYGPIKHSIYGEIFGFVHSLLSVGITFLIAQLLFDRYKWKKKNAERVALGGAMAWVFTAFNWISIMPIGLIAAASILVFLGINNSKKWLPVLVNSSQTRTHGLVLGYTSLLIVNGFFWWPGYQLFVALGISGLVIGDNFAAIAGNAAKKHRLRFSDSRKSIEGVAAMFITTFIFNILIAYLMIQIPGMQKFFFRLSIITLATVLSTAAELFSPKGFDNLIIGPVTAIPLYFYIH